MSTRYITVRRLREFFNNLKDVFSPIGHKHVVAEIDDYVVDSALSSDSTNPVENKAVHAALANKSDVGHMHNIAEVDGLQTELDTLEAEIATKTRVQLITWEEGD